MSSQICKLLNVNIQSIYNKSDELSVILERENIDVACVTEHWLNDENTDNIKIDGYELISHFSRTTFKHGGVMLLTRLKKATPLTEIEGIDLEEKTFEAAGLFIQSIHSAIIGVYCSPHGSLPIFYEKLDRLMNLIAGNSRYKYIYVMGDFNIDTIRESTEKHKLLNLFNMYGLSPLFQEASRVTLQSRT